MALAALPSSPTLSPADIISLAKKRRNDYAERDAWYDKLLGYYGEGEGTKGRPYDPPVLAMNAQGRPLMRPFEVGGSVESKRGYNAKRLAPIVDDYMSLKGRMPHSRSIPPHGPQGEQKADILTKFLYSTYEMSSMDLQQAEAGFNLSLFGDTCYILEPANIDGQWRVVWTVLGPRSCYPSFFGGYQRFKVYDLIIVQERSSYDLNNTYRDYGINIPEDSPPQERTVTTYISPYQRTSVIGVDNPKRGPHADWDLPFCPAAWAYNRVPGQMGMADIQHALTQEDFLNFLTSVLADGIVHMTYPIVGIKNPQNVNVDQMQQGPGAPPVELQADGDIIIRSTQGDIKAAMSMIEHTLQDINAGTGSSSVRQTGDMKTSITTGRAVHAVQGPQSTRIDLWQQMMGATIQSLNSMTLEMQEKAPYLSKFDGDVYGSFRQRSFQVKFNARNDIDGWYRNQVRWEQMVGLNLQQKVSIAYEGRAAKMWDLVYARELAGVDDPIGMDDRIEQEMIREARMQADVQKVMGGGQEQSAGPGPTNPSPSGPSTAAAGMSGGGAAPVPQPVMRPPNMMQQQMQTPEGQAPPPPKGAGLEQLKLALTGIGEQLKGQVFAVGELAIDGSSQAPQIAITDSRDYTRVLQVVRAVAPQGKVRQVDSGKLPAEAVKLV